jgi:2-polyprenyl-6-methoxyphenol hydroxylase-like FAD-dependent oxidoreductase
VIVVGGGIGGLSAAIALRGRGDEVLVLERAPRLGAVGAGITLFANAMNALGLLGVADAVTAAGSPARHSAILTSTGRQLTALPADLLEGAIAVHRGDLQAILFQASGGVRLGAEVASVAQTADGVVATIDAG